MSPIMEVRLLIIINLTQTSVVCGPSFYEVLEAQTLDYKLYMLLMTQISVVDGPTLYEVHEAETLNYMSLMTQISVVCVASVYMKSLEPRL